MSHDVTLRPRHVDYTTVDEQFAADAARATQRSDMLAGRTPSGRLHVSDIETVLAAADTMTDATRTVVYRLLDSLPAVRNHRVLGPAIASRLADIGAADR